MPAAKDTRLACLERVYEEAMKFARAGIWSPTVPGELYDAFQPVLEALEEVEATDPDTKVGKSKARRATLTERIDSLDQEVRFAMALGLAAFIVGSRPKVARAPATKAARAVESYLDDRRSLSKWAEAMKAMSDVLGDEGDRDVVNRGRS